MDQCLSRIGFYGKLASHGDFISRRLSPAFQRTWDRWLQEGLICSRERLGSQWPAAYVCSPIWCFALASGACGDASWAGLFMPSVDRVGRCFPLTLAYGGPQISPLDRFQKDGEWYEQLEALALTSLERDFCLAAFDSALLNLREPSRHITLLEEPSRRTDAPEYWFELSDEQRWEDLLPSLDLVDLRGRTLFWTSGSPDIPPSLVVSRGLPSGRTFADMLSGRRSLF